MSRPPGTRSGTPRRGRTRAGSGPAARGASQGRLELDLLARPHDVRERRACSVPDDRVAERIEPVVRELDALSAARAPGRGARVLEHAPARPSSPRRAARRARSASQRTASGPAGTGCSPTRSIAARTPPCARPHSAEWRLAVAPRSLKAGASRPHRSVASTSTLGSVEVGEIAVEGVARRFRVHAREARTLKDLFVQRGKTEATDVWALRDVSVEVGRGEAVGLIGRNGSGKTTLLRLIAGIINPPRDASARRAASDRCSSSAPASTWTSPAARTSS